MRTCCRYSFSFSRASSTSRRYRTFSASAFSFSPPISDTICVWNFISSANLHTHHTEERPVRGTWAGMDKATHHTQRPVRGTLGGSGKGYTPHTERPVRGTWKEWKMDAICPPNKLWTPCLSAHQICGSNLIGHTKKDPSLVIPTQSTHSDAPTH